MQRDNDFGRRVRAARGFAGISQGELATRIRERYAGAGVSTRTIKRIEDNDPAVKGSLTEWSVWVADATGTPDWFLEGGWDGPRGRPWHVDEYRALERKIARMMWLLEALESTGEREPRYEDLLAEVKRVGIEAADDDSPERLMGRLEERQRVDSRRARKVLEKWTAVEHERRAIRQGASQAERQVWQGQRRRADAELHEYPLDGLGYLEESEAADASGVSRGPVRDLGDTELARLHDHARKLTPLESEREDPEPRLHGPRYAISRPHDLRPVFEKASMKPEEINAFLADPTADADIKQKLLEDVQPQGYEAREGA